MFFRKNYAPHISIYIVQSFTLNHMIQKNCFYINWCKDMHIYRNTQVFLYILFKTCNKNTELLHPMIYQKKRYKAQKTPKIRGKEI